MSLVPIEPFLITRDVTALDLSSDGPTDFGRSWAEPTLFRGREVTA
jgi:hypothetical protein